jgi:hypothetical protein
MVALSTAEILPRKPGVRAALAGAVLVEALVEAFWAPAGNEVSAAAAIRVRQSFVIDFIGYFVCVAL